MTTLNPSLSVAPDKGERPLVTCSGQCPGKTEEHRMQGQHSHPKHIERANP